MDGYVYIQIGYILHIDFVDLIKPYALHRLRPYKGKSFAYKQLSYKDSNDNNKHRIDNQKNLTIGKTENLIFRNWI